MPNDENKGYTKIGKWQNHTKLYCQPLKVNILKLI